MARSWRRLVSGEDATNRESLAQPPAPRAYSPSARVPWYTATATTHASP
jgi:hypothetical protein